MKNSYSEYQLMNTFLYHFQQGIKYSAQIAINQEESSREEYFVDQKLFNIYDLQINYMNLENSVRNNDRNLFDQSR